MTGNNEKKFKFIFYPRYGEITTTTTTIQIVEKNHIAVHKIFAFDDFPAF